MRLFFDPEKNLKRKMQEELEKPILFFISLIYFLIISIFSYSITHIFNYRFFDYNFETGDQDEITTFFILMFFFISIGSFIIGAAFVIYKNIKEKNCDH